MSDLTSLPAAVVADTIARTVELGVTITDAAVDGDATVLFCDLLDDGQRGCPGCGIEGRYRDTAIRTVTDVPVVGHPLRLQVRVPRYRCVNTACGREVFAHNTDRLGLFFYAPTTAPRKLLRTKQGPELAYPPDSSTHWMSNAFMDALRGIPRSCETHSGARLDRSTRWCGHFLNRWRP